MQGIWTALITPFDHQNKVDFSSFRRILKDQVAAGVSGVIPCGTTGESPTLTLDEKKSLITTALEETSGSNVKVFAGTGSNCTEESLQFSLWAEKAGVDGVMLVTPYYNKPSQQGLENHFRTIANEVSCEIMLYNVPGRTGVSLTPETIARLASHPRIKTIKEATGNVSFSSEILDVLSLQNSNIDILSGDDATYLPMLSVGAKGVVSVASNLFPRAMVSIQRAFESGQIEEAKKIHQNYYPLFRDLFVESNPVPIKYAMSQMGWCLSHVRSPLAPLIAASQEKLNKSLSRCGIQKGKAQ